MSPPRASRLFALTCPLCPSGGVQSRPSLAARARRTRARGRTRHRAEGAGLPQTLTQCPTSWTCTYPHPAALYTPAHTPALTRTPRRAGRRRVFGAPQLPGASLPAWLWLPHSESPSRADAGPARCHAPAAATVHIGACIPVVSAASRHIAMLPVE